MYSQCSVLSVAGSCEPRNEATVYEGEGHSGSALASSVEDKRKIISHHFMEMRSLIVLVLGMRI